MKVLIVAKTHMQTATCVGGLLLENNRSIRLLQSNGHNQPFDTSYMVGQVWDIEFKKQKNTILPHHEDVLVQNQVFLGVQANLKAYLLRRIEPWEGSISKIFDGLINFTQSGSGYISKRTGVPNMSTGYWLLDKPLLCDEGEKIKYRYIFKTYRFRNANIVESKNITYVGYEKPLTNIPENTLVRVSLARWWSPPSSDIEERCYLQLSGWYF